MGYYYDDDEDEFNRSSRSFSRPVLMGITGVSVAILGILLLVLATNNTSSGRNNFSNGQMLARATETPKESSALDVAQNYADYVDEYGNKDIEKLYKDGKLRASDLDFWNMYDKNSGSYVVIVTPEPTQNPDDEGNGNGEVTDNEGATETRTPSATNASSEASPDSTARPTQTATATPTTSPGNGLLADVKENNIVYTNLKSVNNKMQYTVNGNIVSHVGVDVSASNGTVDFKTLKDNGVDFVMLCVGSRGYDSGVINKDANFDTNIKAAKEAGLDIGLYFQSRAVTEKEASEEAQYCISQSREYTIGYPIAFQFDGELFDSARTDILEMEDRTDVAAAFMREVKNQGFNTILYGSVKYILEELEPDGLLQYYDVYLNDQGIVPDYPYQFKMWKYKSDVVIPGMEKAGSYIISFVDYANR